MEHQSQTESRAVVYAMFTIMILTAALGNLSQTAVNAMLTDIMLDFNMAVDLGQWLTTSYMLVLGITVPIVSYLSRRFSVRQQVFIAFAFFLVGSLADLFAPNFGVMLIGRIFQAISTGMIMPLMQTIAMTRFGPGRQATAMGMAGIAMGFAPNIGPTIGGAISFAWGWRYFFIFLTLALVVLVVAAFIGIKSSQVLDRSAHLDAISLVQSTLGFGGLLLGFSNASSFSFESPFIWLPIIVGALFLVLFVRRQRRVDDPLINMDIFKTKQFRGSFIAQNLQYASFMGVTLVVPLYVIQLWGGTALDAGLVLLPGAIVALPLNPIGGMLTDRFGIRPVALTGGLFMAVGAVLMSFLDADTPLYIAILCQAIRAIGVSCLVNPLMSWGLESLPTDIVADGSSFTTAVRQATASLGTSIMVLIIVVVGSMAISTTFPALPYQCAFGFSAVMAIATCIYIIVRAR